MVVLIDGLLPAEDVARARETLAAAQWRDGKETAGPAARAVKANQQAARSDAIEALEGFVTDALSRHPVFAAAARPAKLSRLLFSRYTPGETYGAHTDDALMRAADGSRLRTDLAFTLFLADPESYDGGALTIDTSGGEHAVKLPAGGLVLYPATTIHWVTPVTRGARLAAVGWAQSLVRRAEERDILFDLATARARFTGPREDALLLDKAVSNLLRLWAET